MFKINKKIIIISILVISIVLIVLSLLRRSETETKITDTVEPISITNSDPENNSLGFNVFDPLLITFNQPVSYSIIKVYSEPSESWSISNILPNTIQIQSKQYLRVATKYEVSIYKEDTIIGNITFETNHEQNDPRLLQELKSELDNNYPLVSLTPYEKVDYRVVYIAPLTLEIEIKEKSNLKTSKEKALSEVKNWVRSQNIDPETHKYTIK